MNKEYLTTFQAAQVMSVTPDSVLKWIKSGLLNARKTPGGHYRISRKNLETLLEGKGNKTQAKPVQQKKVFVYCWEFNNNKLDCQQGCDDCVVYKIRAERCYKISNFPTEFGHLRKFCKSSCDDCEYYKFLKSSN